MTTIKQLQQAVNFFEDNGPDPDTFTGHLIIDNFKGIFKNGQLIETVLVFDDQFSKDE